MAIIRCPSCSERVSNKRSVCPHCGFDIGGEGDDGLPLEEAEARIRKHRRARLQMHSYAATLIFVIGIAWMMLETGGNVFNASYPSMFVTIGGAMWYFILRGMMVWQSRH